MRPREVKGDLLDGFFLVGSKLEVEQGADTTLEDTFAYLYRDMPDLHAEQLARRKS